MSCKVKFLALSLSKAHWGFHQQVEGGEHTCHVKGQVLNLPRTQEGPWVTDGWASVYFWAQIGGGLTSSSRTQTFVTVCGSLSVAVGHPLGGLALLSVTVGPRQPEPYVAILSPHC